MKEISETTKISIIAEAKRVIEILESDVDLTDYYKNYSVRAELSNKMKELRRDTLRLEKEMYHYRSY